MIVINHKGEVIQYDFHPKRLSVKSEPDPEGWVTDTSANLTKEQATQLIAALKKEFGLEQEVFDLNHKIIKLAGSLRIKLDSTWPNGPASLSGQELLRVLESISWIVP